MSISYVEVGENLPRIKISGRLSTSGTDSIATQVVDPAAASKQGVVVDLDTVR